MGPVGDVKELLRTMTGVTRGASLEQLLRHYHKWGQLDTRADPIPAAYNENDQTKYAGLYVAQEIAASCAQGHSYTSSGRGCFAFLHDGGRRCAPGCVGGAARSHSLRPRLALDRANALFENMFHSGPHHVGPGGRLVKSASRLGGSATPLVLHYNGPSKVVFEREWQLSRESAARTTGHPSWDPLSGKTPVLYHLEGLRRARTPAALTAAANAFEANVTLIDPWLRRASSIGPLRYSCDVPTGRP